MAYLGISEVIISPKKRGTLLLGHYIETYFDNLSFILSLTNLSQKEVDRILIKFCDVLTQANNTLAIYRSINLFLINQFNLYERKVNDETLIEIIESTINILIYKRGNFYDHIAISQGEISSIYVYAKNQNIRFKNINLVHKLLKELVDLKVSEKIRMTDSLLFNIYDIGTKDIKQEVEKYILGFDPKDADTIGSYLWFELILVAREFKALTKNIIQELEKYLKSYETATSYSTELRSLNSVLDYLIKEKELKELNKCSEKIKKIIENHKTNFPSIF